MATSILICHHGSTFEILSNLEIDPPPFGPTHRGALEGYWGELASHGDTGPAGGGHHHLTPVDHPHGYTEVRGVFVATEEPTNLLLLQSATWEGGMECRKDMFAWIT